jgi:outer membrane protein W
MKKFLLIVLLLLPTFTSRATFAGDFFAQGSSQFSLLAGSGTAYNNDYLILGVGVNYYLIDGLGVGLSYENWSGNSPSINQTSPSIQYVFSQGYSIRPYIGAFYRNTAIANQSSINSEGARAGVYFTAGSNSVIGIGLVYESYLNCQPTVFGGCSETYPEIALLFGF